MSDSIDLSKLIELIEMAHDQQQKMMEYAKLPFNKHVCLGSNLSIIVIYMYKNSLDYIDHSHIIAYNNFFSKVLTLIPDIGSKDKFISFLTTMDDKTHQEFCVKISALDAYFSILSAVEDSVTKKSLIGFISPTVGQIFFGVLLHFMTVLGIERIENFNYLSQIMANVKKVYLNRKINISVEMEQMFEH